MDASYVADDLESVILTEEQILDRVATLAREVGKDYAGREPLLIGVLGGAATFTVDLARAFEGQVEVSWMAIRSYTTRNRASAWPSAARIAACFVQPTGILSTRSMSASNPMPAKYANTGSRIKKFRTMNTTWREKKIE